MSTKSSRPLRRRQKRLSSDLLSMAIVGQLRRVRARLERLYLADLLFWGLLFGLNALVFLPIFGADLPQSLFWPTLPDTSERQDLIRHFLGWRDNLDIFRLNTELVLLFTFWAVLPWLKKSGTGVWMRRAILLAVILTFLYQGYEAAIGALTQSSPNFYSQFRLVLDNVHFVYLGLQLSLARVLLVITVILATSWLLLRGLTYALQQVRPERLSVATRLLMILLAAGVVMHTFLFQESLSSSKMVVSSLTAKIWANVERSRNEADRVASLATLDPTSVYQYGDYQLLRKPDIYLIFIESYGSVLYKRTPFAAKYTQMAQEMEEWLGDQGWYMASALSESTTWGGGSWLAYSSAQFGLHIDTHPQFLELRSLFADGDYPHLGRYLQSQGYSHTRISPLNVALAANEWDANAQFYGADRWVRYTDLDYGGWFYGWGPAVPDQFTLNRARELLVSSSEQPRFLFYLTQNSHYPWAPQPPYVDDWRTLARRSGSEPERLQEPVSYAFKTRAYSEAIRYQLEFLSDFIIDTEDDAIFVLIGDHQPQGVSMKNDGLATPIHIIARDSDFVSGFENYGFVNGIDLDNLEPAMKHEGFLSMFVRELLKAYGADPHALPPYLPDGIALSVQPELP